MVGEFDPVFTKFWLLASLALVGSRGPLRNAGAWRNIHGNPMALVNPVDHLGPPMSEL
jgi:hypothetical protein